MSSHSEKMLLAISENDLIEAQLQFEQALREDDPEVLAQLGEQLLASGFLEEAQEIFSQLLEDYPEEKSLTIPLAEIAIENDQTELAFEYLESIPKDHGSYVESLLVLADLYQVIGVPEVSEKKIKEAQAIMPNELILDLALAELYFSTDKLTEAIRIYEQILATGEVMLPSINLNERLGTALGMIGEFEEAIAYLELALAEEQTDQRLFQLGITYIQAGNREKAISFLQQLRLLNPSFESLYLPLASAMLDEQMNVEAEKVMAEGLEQNPYAIDLYHLASDNAFRLGKTAEAEEYMRKAIALEEDKEFSLIKLSNLLLVEERFDDVIETLSELATSSQPLAHWSLAQAYNGLEDFPQAGKHYAQAYQELQHEPDFLKDYGLYLREEGHSAQANELLQHYLQHVPGDIDVYNLLEE